MIFVKFLVILVILRSSNQNEIAGGNFFLERLNKLLDFCIVNLLDVDEQIVFGVIIANGQLKAMKRTFEVENLIKKCEILETKWRNKDESELF